ncbi:DUF302 domain-containing protein [Fertoebacter nigrum]|uniref:DUF302 domain-containing protein n=1 Tax=Fertoeibacter niger TaxID=2656921 RepID=A0A8X8H3N2_9RHOB|nr:DUF302 domain-containing protein [Fertoeibacter niger]NUB45734.1 DUF302 domain-containing protein [Fertoeibacter niger]
MHRLKLSLLALILGAPAALAQDATTYPFEGSFDDAAFAVESAIIGKGLVIDYRSHVGDMLNRTGADVGSAVTVFDSADVFLFCSAVLSRKVMEADPLNIAHCPYGIFITDQNGQVAIGFRHLPEGPMQEVQALLDDIAREAVGE